LIYAPYADRIELKKHITAIHGAVWGGPHVKFEFKGSIYFDINLRNKYLSRDVTLAAWKDDWS